MVDSDRFRTNTKKVKDKHPLIWLLWWSQRMLLANRLLLLSNVYECISDLHMFEFWPQNSGFCRTWGRCGDICLHTGSRQSNLLHLFTIFTHRNRRTEWCNVMILVVHLFLVDHVVTVRWNGMASSPWQRKQQCSANNTPVTGGSPIAWYARRHHRIVYTPQDH